MAVKINEIYTNVTEENFNDFFLEFVEIVLKEGKDIYGYKVIRGYVDECEDADDNDYNVAAFGVTCDNSTPFGFTVYLDQIESVKVIQPLWKTEWMQ